MSWLRAPDVCATGSPYDGLTADVVFTIEMLPADEGDALWIEYGEDGGDVHRVLIDCGRSTAYRAVADRVDDDTHFDLFVLTHVDADHISGAVRLLQDGRFGPSRVDDVWFNGWRHLHRLHKDPDAPAPEVLSAKQGEYFGAVLRQRDYPWNEAFGGYAAVIDDDGEPPSFTLAGGMRLTVLAPTWQELTEMAARWKRDIDGLPDDKKLAPGDWERALELLDDDRSHGPDVLGGSRGAPEGPIVMNHLLEVEFDPDESEPNGSSIALLAEFDGITVLFAGDAHAPQLARSVERLLADRPGDRLRVDAYKMSHHGSARNNSVDLLELLECRRVLVSTNGKRHDHPDREAIARVLATQPQGVELHFNFATDFTLPWNDDALVSQYGYVTYYPSAASGGLVVRL